MRSNPIVGTARGLRRSAASVRRRDVEADGRGFVFVGRSPLRGDDIEAGCLGGGDQLVELQEGGAELNGMTEELRDLHVTVAFVRGREEPAVVLEDTSELFERSGEARTRQVDQGVERDERAHGAFAERE